MIRDAARRFCLAAMCLAAQILGAFAVERHPWFDARISDYAVWPVNLDQASTEGGRWSNTESAARADGALAVDASDEAPLMFIPETPQKIESETNAVEIVSTIAFTPFPAAALPEIPEDANAGVIVVAEADGSCRYYILAAVAGSAPAANEWRATEVAASGRGAIVKTRISAAGWVVYTLDGTMLKPVRVALASEIEVAAAKYTGRMTVSSLCATNEIGLPPVRLPQDDTPLAVTNALADAQIPSGNGVYDVVLTAEDIQTLNALLKENGVDGFGALTDAQRKFLRESFLVKDAGLLAEDDANHLYETNVALVVTDFAPAMVGATPCWRMRIEVRDGVDAKTALKVAARELAKTIRKAETLSAGAWKELGAEDIKATSSDGTTVILSVTPPGTDRGFLRLQLSK